MSAAALTREIADAGLGVGRLIRDDPRWADGFDPSVGGFLRSFIAPLLGLPFYLVFAAVLATDPGATAGAMPGGGVAAAVLWTAATSHLVGALAYPLVVAGIARLLGLGAGYTGFVVVVNWSTLFLDAASAGVSVLKLAGPIGYALFGVCYLGLFAISLFVVWRAARATLSPDIPSALLMVVLSVGVAALADHLAGWLFGVAVS